MSYYHESAAEKKFREAGPIIHLCTKPLESDFFFRDDNEKTLALNYVALAKVASGCRILALAIMTNHFHFILEASERQTAAFWNCFKELLETYLDRHGRPKMLDRVEPVVVRINNLQQLRTEIAYVIRNPFVVRTDVHVFADPWSSGYLYFNPLLEKSGVPASSLKGRAIRTFTCTRSITSISGDIMVKDGRAQMWSFIDYEYTEGFFDSARQFIHTVMKNVEAQVEIAKRYGENPCLSDEELAPLVFKRCREYFKAADVKDLDIPAKKELAVWLKKELGASNKQIARQTKLFQREVDELFPLSAK
jgi:hypothetical protein